MANSDMDKLRNAEFKEAFDEFDTVSDNFKIVKYKKCLGWQRHNLP